MWIFADGTKIRRVDRKVMARGRERVAGRLEEYMRDAAEGVLFRAHNPAPGEVRVENDSDLTTFFLQIAPALRTRLLEWPAEAPPVVDEGGDRNVGDALI